MKYFHSATLQRLSASGANFVYTANGTSVCFLQPLDTESSVAMGMEINKAHVCYFPLDTDIKEKDRAVISAKKYSVKGVRSHEYGGLAHKRAILELI